MAFVLGASPASERAKLAAEDALFGDVIVGNSVDSYRNLSLKTLSMLEWADTSCALAPRLLKTDDDVFLNVPRLRRNVLVSPPKPNRSKRSRYYISPVQFPAANLPC